MAILASVATFEQSDFSAGIYRGLKAPASSVYNALNALVSDEGNLFKRGGAAMFSGSDLGAVVDGIAAVNLAVGSRVIVWGDGQVASMNPTTGAITAIPSIAAPLPGARVVVVDGIAIWIARTTPSVYYGWAGSALTTGYSIGTVTVTQNSDQVTGSATSWVANVDPGTILLANGQSAVVRNVTSDTALTLTRPWQGPTFTGVYQLEPFAAFSVLLGPAGSATFSVAAAVGLQNRLLLASGERIYIAQPWHPFTFDTDPTSGATLSFVDMPRGEAIVAMQGIGDTALVFTTGGVWQILNTSLDLVDDSGNVQWQVQQVDTQVVAWGDPGVALYAGGVIVPALDDVYIVALDGSSKAISEGIRPLYRGYVASGYKPGKAAIYHGHYLLPIVDGVSSTPIDVLVCRLDRGAPWTRWNAYAAGPAYATYISPTTGQPSLFGSSGERVTNATGCFTPDGSNQSEITGPPTFRVDTNDFDLGPGIRPNTVEKVRAKYETIDGVPVITVSWATGQEGASYTSATLKRGGGASDGTGYSAWKVTKKAERIRFRFQTSSQVSSLILRRLEVTVRPAAQN